MSALRALDETQSRSVAAQRASKQLGSLRAADRVRRVVENLPGPLVLSSSFGAQSALMLHLVTRELPDIPVILVDTGYLFPETYQFVDVLTEQLKLNLKVFQPRMSPAWQEAMYGRRWEQGAAGIDAYNQDNKVEPMQRALAELKAATWLAGLRRDQSNGRRDRQIVELAGDRWKVHPIIDFSDRDVHHYLKAHGLPYHPLWDAGYVSIGDWHTTRSLAEVDSVDETRFFGLKRECGLHTAI
ncbi:MAG: phosphoadenylyl-sulfate reductase [Pseudomonadota bacterium]